MLQQRWMVLEEVDHPSPGSNGFIRHCSSNSSSSNGKRLKLPSPVQQRFTRNCSRNSNGQQQQFTACGRRLALWWCFKRFKAALIQLIPASSSPAPQ
jgi:hypothetical protein